MRTFHLFSLFTLAVGVVLIWWGAAVTTEDVGLAVPDWPLCFGKLNPKGWWWVPALRLEHGHRWLATLVGLQVLAMYLWQFFKFKPSFMEVAGVILVGLGFLFLVFRVALVPASIIAGISLVWLVTTWIAHRWPLLRGLATAALFLIIGQAALGGLRVLKMSDPFGITHGTLGQLFFCLLVLVAFTSSPVFTEGRLWLDPSVLSRARVWTTFLFLSVFGQLLIGAILRHTQRTYLAATDILTTKGVLIPPANPPDAFMLFLHKYWGFSVAIIIIAVARQARHWFRAVPAVRIIPAVLLILPLAQVTLGIYVILTGKSFWVTNFHVLNGLALLALSFLLMAAAWASKAGAPDAAAATRPRPPPELAPDKPATLA